MAMRKLSVITGLAIAVALGAGVVALNRSDRPVTLAKAAPGPARAGVAVETAAVARETVVEDIRAFGTLVADESVVV